MFWPGDFLTAEPQTAPRALLHSLKHYKVLHERNAILTIRSATVPRVPDAERIQIERLDENFDKIVMRFGYMEEPNVPKALAPLPPTGNEVRHHVDLIVLPVASFDQAVAQSGMPVWQDKLFIALAHNASDAQRLLPYPYWRVVG